MRRPIALLILLSSCLYAHAKSAPNPADYPITVHVTGSHLAWMGGPNPSESIDAVIDGQRYELQALQNRVFQLGNYQARIIKEDKKRSYELMRIYEFLLPDGNTRQFQISGIRDSDIPSK